MIFTNSYFEELSFKSKPLEQLVISGCVIKDLDLRFLQLDIPVIICNSIVENFLVNSTWFSAGLRVDDSVFLNDIDYSMGGHNKKAFAFVNTIFKGYFSFEDCHFESEVQIMDCIFIKGSNLLGNKGAGFENQFQKITLRGNMGQLDVND